MRPSVLGILFFVALLIVAGVVTTRTSVSPNDTPVSQRTAAPSHDAGADDPAIYVAQPGNGSGNAPVVQRIGPVPRGTDAADRAVIAALRKAGSDVSRPTNIRHYFYMPTEREAGAVALTLRAYGYHAWVEAPLGKLSDGRAYNDWAVIAEKTAVPSLQTFRDTRPIFDELVVKYHGRYDGWEAQLQR
ncbi:MAG: ribonuclease E inhibitor RraB [Candidatus Eremiobacteraeota bacterium]|nr:ribonuclease E inhibitor RraB [Candidatus Eremiobacteraeota bacterium]